MLTYTLHMWHIVEGPKGTWSNGSNDTNDRQAKVTVVNLKRISEPLQLEAIWIYSILTDRPEYFSYTAVNMPVL